VVPETIVKQRPLISIKGCIISAMSESSTASQQIARSAGAVMLAIVLGQFASLARQILVTRAFGTDLEMEAFNAANRVAETLFTLVAGGALASAFIPTLTGLLAQEKRKRAWQLASALVNLVLILLIGATLLTAVFAQPIVRYALASGFASDPAKEALTVTLLRLMLPSAVLFGVSGLVMGILNSHQVFFIPALAPSFYQLGLIFGVLFLAPRMGIYGLGWGAVVGAALHLTFQLPALLRLRGQYYPRLGLEQAEVRQVFRLLGPRLLGVAVVQVNFWVNTNLASRQPEGSVTAIVIAFMLMLMPQAAIAQATAMAAMPTLAAQYARGQISELRSSLAAALRGVLLLAVPAAVGLMALRTPIVALLYERGRFTSESTALVAWALLWYAAGLVGHSVMEVLARAFYAMQDTRTPVLVGVGAMSLNVAFSFGFSALFLRIGWAPHGGLALANSLATALETVGLWILMRRRLGGLEEQQVGTTLRKAALASLAMGGGLIGWLALAGGLSVRVIAPVGLAGGIALYGMGLLVQGADELKTGLAWAAKRFGRTRPRINTDEDR
jgi:putative peptidoglycan lipid II flippase